MCFVVSWNWFWLLQHSQPLHQVWTWCKTCGVEFCKGSWLYLSMYHTLVLTQSRLGFGLVSVLIHSHLRLEHMKCFLLDSISWVALSAALFCYKILLKNLHTLSSHQWTKPNTSLYYLSLCIHLSFTTMKDMLFLWTYWTASSLNSPIKSAFHRGSTCTDHSSGRHTVAHCCWPKDTMCSKANWRHAV